MSTVGSVAIVFTSVLSVVAAWLLWTRAQRRLRYDLKDIPGPKQQPLIGNLRSVLGSSYLHKVLARWTAHYGPIYKWNLSGMDVLVITDPHEVFKLSSRELNLPKASFFYKGVNTRAPHNNILATPDYEEWKYFRRMTNFAFSPDNIRKAYPRIYDATLRASAVLQKLCKGGITTLDMGNMSSRTTAEVINAIAFDMELGALDCIEKEDGTVVLTRQKLLEDSKQFQSDLSLTFTNPMYALLLVLCPWLERAKQRKATAKCLADKDDELAAIIQKRGVQPESNTSLWACLSRFVSYKDGGPIPVQTLAANAGIFFAAGFETTAHAISWALFELAADPTLQVRVQEELREAGLAASPGSPPPRSLDYADLSKLKMLDAIAKEALRLHATAPIGSVREADKDMVIMGYRIPQGTPLMLAPYPMHVSPHNYMHPYKFWPDRWLTDPIAEDNLKQSGSVHNSYAAFFAVGAAAICLLACAAAAVAAAAVSAKVAACVIPACHWTGARLLSMVKMGAFVR
ncbi:TPA: hypothetical protein ACH3X2_010475 [Trebouxia sp. C0005]